MERERRAITTRTTLGAPPREVWARALSPEGINHELGPWMRMTVPAGLRGMTVENVPLGVPLGRSWILALGVIPFDCDNLRLAERGPGFRFLESSSMLSMKSWQHERRVQEIDDGCELCDRVQFELRRPLAAVPGLERVVLRLIAATFRHRHRRALAYFG